MSLGWRHPAPEDWQEHVRLSLREDIGHGDQSAGLFRYEATTDWFIEAQGEGVLCGAGIAYALLRPEPDHGHSEKITLLMTDGETIAAGDKILEGHGRASFIFTRERTALNYLMHLSGVATTTSKYVSEVGGTGAAVVDTRKTVPGLRSLDKYAVRCGGGHNHRMGLFDGVMIKDNHIAAAGSISDAVKNARKMVGHMMKVEVECETPEMVSEAVEAGADIVLLDNMDVATMSSVVRKYKGKVLLEASGGITHFTIRDVAKTGVDIISVGALTHSAPAVPFHLEVKK